MHGLFTTLFVFAAIFMLWRTVRPHHTDPIPHPNIYTPRVHLVNASIHGHRWGYSNWARQTAHTTKEH